MSYETGVAGPVYETGVAGPVYEAMSYETMSHETMSHETMSHETGVAGPVLPRVSDCLLCEDCGREFLESFLLNHFDLSVCDSCREKDEEEKYNLITKTDAKKKFLLKDEDFDMKLFLELQVQVRAYEVWGDEDGMEKARAERTAKKEKAKKKKFDKRVRELRMAVRSSTWRKDTKGHEHDYGEESYREGTDDYCQTCTTCGHAVTFEKM
ncbi:hypothetical protein ACOMHN_021471 [Nucella lapillus]